MTEPGEKDLNMEHARPTVAHVHRVFFNPTETFIYNLVAGLSRFHPVFVAREFANLERFPVPPQDRLALNQSRFTWRWVLQGLGRRLLNRELLAERFLIQRRASLLHAHFGQYGAWALRLKRALGLPLVTTFYGHDASRTEHLREHAEGYSALFREGDLFLVEGPHMMKRLEALGCPAEKIAVQRIAIPLDRLLFRERRPKRSGENVVLIFSGRFVEKKGLLTALAAVQSLSCAHPGFEFRIIGDGPLRPDIERFIQSHGLHSRVRLLGFQDYPSYLRQMQEADLFIHPSMTAADGDGEGGAPTSILEAQALGLPVLATFHDDIPYIVAPGKSALLSPEGDTAALATNIARLLDDPDSWAEMGQAGRRHVEAYHAPAHEITRLEDMYDNVISARRSAGPLA
jgi:colanic acid/amylovoran biosynthesis glycosyltransferase